MISITFKQLISTSCANSFTSGFCCCNLVQATTAFFCPISSGPYKTCRCKLVDDTTSKSAIATVPIPADTRYIAAGQPRPPAPMINTFATCNFCWLFSPKPGNATWQRYRNELLITDSFLVEYSFDLLNILGRICIC